MKQIEKENRQTLIPLADIVDTGEQLEFFVEIPGVQKENTQVELEQGSLKIKGVKRMMMKNSPFNFLVFLIFQETTKTLRK